MAMKLSPETWARVKADREKRKAKVAEIWKDKLTPNDWLFDGHTIRGPIMQAMFDHLDWDRAWMDLGPSVAGNPGPYWHVPLRAFSLDGEIMAAGDTVHRLYPKILQSKWAMLILHACYEAQKKCEQCETREAEEENADVSG